MTRTASQAAVAACFVFCLAGAAPAARILPEPLLGQFEQGYGVVEAVVTSARPGKTAIGATLSAYHVVFRVAGVVAEPVRRKLGLEAGEQFTLRLAVGYARQIEELGRRTGTGGTSATADKNPLASGTRYLLTVRAREGGGFEHAPGAGAAERIKKLGSVRVRTIRAVREVAALPEAQRVVRLRALAAAPKADQALRLIAFDALADRAVRGRADATENDATAEALMALWNDPQAELSGEMFVRLDAALCPVAGDEFTRSAQRRDAWLARVFAAWPGEPAARAAALTERENTVLAGLLDLARLHPKAVGERVVRELDAAAGPAQFRWRIAWVLQRMVQEFDAPRPEWTAALRQYYPRALAEADAWVLRLLASSLRMGLRARPPAQRVFRPDAATVEATVAALERMGKERSGDRPDPNAASAVYELTRVVEGLAE